MQFSRRLIETRGKVEDGDLAYCRSVGFSDAEIIEMIALSAQYLLTNFINNVAATEIDFPGHEARMRAE